MLYKFHPINEFLFQLLLDSCLWCSNAKDFNDPFDLKFTLDFPISINEKTKQLEHLIDNIIATGPYFVDKEKVTKEYLPLLEDPEFDKKTMEFVSQEIQKLGVCCFSQQFHNILMWSHYANGHKGVCLGFDFPADENSNFTMLTVKYSNEYPVIRNLNEARIGLQTKSKFWKYEKEVRLINYSGAGKVSFQTNSLKEVVFGAKTSSEDINRIKKILEANNYQNVKFKRAMIRNDKYKLQFKRLN